MAFPGIDTVIQLLDRIPIIAPVGAAAKLFAHTQRIVQHGVWQIDKERLIPVLFDELYGFVRVEMSQLRLIGGTFHDLVVPQ